MVDQRVVTGVSLGPGDPDLITLKGLKALQEADVIYFPGSLFANGEKLSYSETILSQLDIDMSKCVGFYLRMNDDRSQANSIYDTTAEEITQVVGQGKHVAVVSEGDINTYSSFSYLLDRFKQNKIDVMLIPGITSYSLAAAKAKLPLTILNDRMVILPRINSEEMLIEALNNTSTVVLMKIRSVMNIIENVLKKEKASVIYAEKLGTAKEYMTSDLNDLKGRTIPYFSLMILQR